MNINALKRIRIERYIFALSMVIIMFFVAGLSGQREIIFPEILAIMTGAWVSETQPWSVNKRKMFILISLSSVIGVCTVRYVHFNLFFQTLICFAFTGASLIITKTNFIPIISACILPVYLRTDSWIYAISVTLMALIVITAQWLMEKYHLRPRNHYVSKNFDFRQEVNHWLKLVCIFALVAVLPIESKNIFFLAPPLIVTFAEFANPKSPLRHKTVEIFGILVSASIVGTVMKVLFNIYLGVPLVLCATFACIGLFIIFNRLNIHFPPAGAIVILPMVLNIDDLKYFPLQVVIGAAILITLSITLFKDKSIQRI